MPVHSGNFRFDIPAGASNLVALPRDVNRIGLLIFNAGANSVFVSFGTDSNSGIEIPTRQYLPQFPQGATPTAEIRVGAVLASTIHIATTRSGDKVNVT